MSRNDGWMDGIRTADLQQKLTFVNPLDPPVSFYNPPTLTLVAFISVTHVHGPSFQPTESRSPTCSLSTVTGTATEERFRPTLIKESEVERGSNQVPKYLGQLLYL